MQPTLDQLKSLKLIGLLEAWQEQQGHPTYHDLTFDERFALMVEREYLRRQHQRLQRRLKQAQLSTPATLEAVDFTVPRGLKKTQFLEWAQGQWLSQHLNLIVMGPTGVGKNLPGLCVGRPSLQAGLHRPLFQNRRTPRRNQSLPRSTAPSPNCASNWPPLTSSFWMNGSAMLSPPMTPGTSSTFLDDRYRRSSCLLATQFPVNQWHPKIQDPTLADAILDRLVHDSLRLPLKGESMRKLTSPLKDEPDLISEASSMT